MPDGNVPPIQGTWRPRVEMALVCLPNGFWYDLATGPQDSFGATHTERA